MNSLNITALVASQISQTLLEGNGDFLIESVASLDQTNERSVSFATDIDKLKGMLPIKAGCLILPLSAKDAAIDFNGPVLYAKNPHWAFVQLLRYMEKRDKAEKWEIHPTAVISKSAVIAANICVGPHAVIEDGAVIGNNTVIGAGVFIGRDVKIGAGTVIHPNVVIEHECVIGNNVILYSGVVIGTDGYGYIQLNNAHEKVPQIGRVIIEDGVEIGANTTIDRGALTDTVIGAGTKIDNLVQIAHGVTTGKACLIISQSGIAGSCKIGNGVIIAGQAGLKDHLTIEDGAIITVRSGIMRDVKKGEVMFGAPARPYRESMKIEAILGKLPEMYKAFRQLNKDSKNEKIDD